MLAAVMHPHLGREQLGGCFVAAEDVRDDLSWVFALAGGCYSTACCAGVGELADGFGG